MRDPKIIEIWTLCVPLAKIFSCYYAKTPILCQYNLYSVIELPLKYVCYICA